MAQHDYFFGLTSSIWFLAENSGGSFTIGISPFFEICRFLFFGFVYLTLFRLVSL